jgi:thioredoxin reductase (NADPH)
MATKKNLAVKYGIQSVPAVVVLDHGEEIERLECSMDKEKLKSLL